MRPHAQVLSKTYTRIDFLSLHSYPIFKETYDYWASNSPNMQARRAARPRAACLLLVLGSGKVVRAAPKPRNSSRPRRLAGLAGRTADPLAPHVTPSLYCVLLCDPWARMHAAANMTAVRAPADPRPGGRAHPAAVGVARGRAAHPAVVHRGRPDRLGMCGPGPRPPCSAGSSRACARQRASRQRARHVTQAPCSKLAAL